MVLIPPKASRTDTMPPTIAGVKVCSSMAIHMDMPKITNPSQMQVVPSGKLAAANGIELTLIS